MKIQIVLSNGMSAIAKAYHLGRVYYDPVNGKGAIPYNQEIDYKGIRVLMRPSMYLSLCYPIREGSAEATNFDFIKEYIKGGNPIGNPWLSVELPYLGQGEFTTKDAYISGHEGRNRVLAIQQLYGDHELIEVHITTSMGSNRYLDEGKRADMRAGLKSQTGRFIKGPLWEKEL